MKMMNTPKIFFISCVSSIVTSREAPNVVAAPARIAGQASAVSTSLFFRCENRAVRRRGEEIEEIDALGRLLGDAAEDGHVDDEQGPAADPPGRDDPCQETCDDGNHKNAWYSPVSPAGF